MLKTAAQTGAETAAATYRPLGDYGLIGDTRTAALVSRSGSIDWLCLPSFPDEAVIAALLDAERGGRFFIRPAEDYRVERSYGERSACLHTVFVTDGGRATLTDMMVLPSEAEHCFEPQREILRSLRVEEGRMSFEVLYEPRPDYARLRPKVKRLGKTGWRCVFDGHLLNLLTDAELEPTPSGAGAGGTIALDAGQSRSFSLTFSESDVAVLAPLGKAAEARARRTDAWWAAWADKCDYDGPHAQMVMRSAITLKLLTYGLSGAVVAAPTASLPEAVGGVRNWDYRFCWLRDASLTMHAFLGLGFREEGAAFFDWLLHTTRLSRPKLAVMYDVFGRTDIPEVELDHLEGYRGSRPVRIGNGAAGQQQLDVYGSVIAAAYEFCLRGGRLDRFEGRLLAQLGDAIAELWDETEHGIWEIREPERHYTYGKIMCWVGLDRLLRLAETGLVEVPAERYETLKQTIRATIEREARDPETGALTGAFGDSTPDAALLLAPRFGYLEASDPLMEATADRIMSRLSKGPLLYRYPSGWDNLPGQEGAFGICSFWQVDYLARAGRVEEAGRLFDALCGYASDVGLYAEEIDPESGEALGNFPQAFTHVGLINAALALREALREGRATRKGCG